MINLVLFISDHCSGCHPMLEKCERIVGNRIDIELEVINIDDSDAEMSLAKSFYVMSTPTLLIKKDNEVVEQIVGNVNPDEIEATLRVIE